MIRAAARVPLFWKILLANAAIVGIAILVGEILGERLAALDRPSVAPVGALVVAGVALSLLLNAVLLRLALEPIERLEATALRVRAGEIEARVPALPLADRGLDRLARTFNGALDALDASRRQVRRLLEEAADREENERRRVATALENDSAQRLAGILMRLRLAERDPRAVAGLVDAARQEILGALEVVRGYASGRRPAVLDDLGLIAALEAHARRIREESDLFVRIEGTSDHRPPPGAELALYRMICEALDNAVRHAAARNIVVRVMNGGDAVVAVVEDDGRGFEPEALSDRPGLGLVGIRERAERAGGHMTVWSAPARGTRVRIEIPLPQKASAAGVA